MQRDRERESLAPSKSATGILGFDEITDGGLPGGRTTLVVGGPGSGKTIFALQFLVHGAQACKEPGVFVAFEESAARIVANAGSFGWHLATLQKRKLHFVDAQPSYDLVQSGNFDLNGLLAALDAKIGSMRAKRIVFDALDIVLALLPDAASQRREVYRLHDWLLARQLTGLITAKVSDGDSERVSFMQFMVDCVVMLNHRVAEGVAQRTLRVQKYRDCSFDENEAPFLIGSVGIEVAVARPLGRGLLQVSKARVSSGVDRLDTMLGGGYYRGASVLITGAPGTAKTTLCGAFVEAACERGERAMFVSFDADSNEVVRDLSSVGIRLARHVKSGVLRMRSARTVAGSAETYLAHVKSLAKAHGARVVVIDPVSSWAKVGTGLSAHSVTERLIDWSKTESITLLCTSLLDELAQHSRGVASLQISTLADTWIHLSYLVQAGERNRALSIMKSRGTAHSNQVRELILSDSGVTLSDTYTAGGEVLMGTMRWEKERIERAEKEVRDVAARLKGVQLDAEEAELEVRLKAVKTELVAKQVERELLSRTAARREAELSHGLTRMQELRGADVAPEVAK